MKKWQEDKNFVLMARKSLEIQAMRGKENWMLGDFYTDDILVREIDIKEEYFNVIDSNGDNPYEMYHPIWLPSQNQLQEIINLKGEYNYDLAQRFMNFIIDNFHTMDSSKIYPCADKNMEQFWLLFVMKEKYNKIWNGEDWIKND